MAHIAARPATIWGPVLQNTYCLSMVGNSCPRRHIAMVDVDEKQSTENKELVDMKYLALKVLH